MTRFAKLCASVIITATRDWIECLFLLGAQLHTVCMAAASVTLVNVSDKPGRGACWNPFPSEQ